MITPPDPGLPSVVWLLAWLIGIRLGPHVTQTVGDPGTIVVTAPQPHSVLDGSTWRGEEWSARIQVA